jgi:hypothetical protein
MACTITPWRPFLVLTGTNRVLDAAREAAKERPVLLTGVTTRRRFYTDRSIVMTYRSVIAVTPEGFKALSDLLGWLNVSMYPIFLHEDDVLEACVSGT